MQAPVVTGLLLLLFGLSAEAEPCGGSGCHDFKRATRPHFSHELQGATSKHAAVTCVDCHGGLPEVKTASVAHTGLFPGRAGCARCHVTGAVAGTDVVALGARAYLDLGCPLCHSTLFTSRSPAAFGPPMESIGIRGVDYLKKVVTAPASVFPKTPMPSFAHYFMQRPDRGQALLVFLSSLRGGPRAVPKTAPDAPCVSCHQDPKKPTGAPHRCRFLHDEKAELGCARCHASGLPAGEGPCAYVERRSFECVVCHEAPGAAKGAQRGG